MADTEEAEARETFRRRLAETIHWCRKRASKENPAGSLRTPALKPGSLGGHGEESLPAGRKHAWRQAAVEGLANSRRELLAKEGFGYWRLPDGLGGGKLVLYEPDRNLFDGGAEASSEGFFDANSVPPWDTWVCYLAEDPGTLVAWVPPALLAKAGAGVAANPEGCLSWAAEAKVELAQVLREWGILA
jgi:hypothetical protein